ncbi:MAG TPA: SDR family oxidoreductase [Actinomycetota bacterium]|nr:SDR family oxidoreductase [Actinomycetota bacterium]
MTAIGGGRVAGRVALVTGAGLGIGRATSIRLAEEGAVVIASSRSLEHAEATCTLAAASLGDDGHRPEAAALDVSDPAAIDRVVDEVADRHGRIDILVANAGVDLPRAPTVMDTTDDEWEQVFAVNVTGLFRCARAVVPLMPPGASIVTVASINSFVAWSNDAAYTASKGAALQFTRSLALDVVDRGIRANCVCPGVIDTPLTQGFRDAAEDPTALAGEYAAVAPMNRMGTAREVANCILFLASDEASFVTGSAMLVDGGTTARA